MKIKSSACPPFTPDDIITLRGQPVSKRIDSSHRSPTGSFEEWIYYNMNTKSKEHYVFKNGKLVGWLQDRI